MLIETITFVDLLLDSAPQLIVGNAARVHSIELIGIDDDDTHVMLYDFLTAAEVTLGTTKPKDVFLIPASDGTNRTGRDPVYHSPLKFNNGLVIACTKAAAGIAGPSGTTPPDTLPAAVVRYT